MRSVTLTKEKTLTDAEQTIADIRALRWELSKRVHSYEDIQKIEQKMSDYLSKLKTENKNY